MMIRRRVLVKGVVQGVSFRKSTARIAGFFGVTGWVRSLPSGEVEACFEGANGDVNQVVQWCKIGPECAQVTGVELFDEPYVSEFTEFKILL